MADALGGTDVEQTTCQQCGDAIAGRAPNARYCTVKCRNRAGRVRRGETHPGRQGSCAQCGRQWFYASKGGTAKKLCPTCASVLRWCYACQSARELVDFASDRSTHDGLDARCRSCSTIARRRYYASPEKARAKRLLDQYGMTPEQYEDMVARQSGLCAICRRPPRGDKRLFVDHCHATGRTRALLCGPCNTGIGQFQDDLKLLASAMRYLAMHVA